MPVFAFTFGSLGDFIALGELIVKLGIALYKPGEATRDYEELRDELNLILQILGHINVCKGQELSTEAAQVLCLVNLQVKECQNIIQIFLNKIPSAPGAKRNIRKTLKWTVTGPRKVADVREKLSRQKDILNMLLQM